MRSLTIRRAAVAAVLPLALGSLTACGANGSSTAADPVAPTSSPAGGASTSGTTDAIHRVRSAQFLAMVKAGARKLTTAKFSMSMDASGQQITADGALDMTGSRPAMKMSMDLSGMGTPTQIILLGGTMYVAVPGGNGTFLEMDLTDPNGPMGSMGDTLGGIDPKSLMDQLSPDVFKKVVYEGTQTVHGQHLKRYSVTVDASAAPMLKGLPSTASLPKTMTYDLWLDEQGRMAKFRMLMQKVVSMTMTYSDFGAPVDITAPDPSRVQSMSGTSG